VRVAKWKRAVAGLALLLAASVSLFALMQGGERQPTASVGGPFQLVDSQKRVVTDRDFRGHDMLVYFGYTSCPDICPTTLASVIQALNQLGPRGDGIQPIFITIDPKRDTPAVIGRYVAAFSPRLIGLTGTAAQIRAVEAAYHVVVRPGVASPDGLEAIDHSAVLYLMGPDGAFLAPLSPQASPATLATDLARFIHAE
jgi:protein SCO1/2